MSRSLRSGKNTAAEREGAPSQHGSDESDHGSDGTTTEDTVRMLRRELRIEREQARRREEASQQQIADLLAALKTTAPLAPPTMPREPEPEEPSTGETTRRTAEWVTQTRDPIAEMTAAIVDAIRSSQAGSSPRQPLPSDDPRMAAFIARQTGAKDLPTFAGDPLEWPTFKSQYYQSTELCGLAAAENLLRLQRALKGKARDAVAALLVDPRNLQQILDTLEMRFGQQEVIVSAMLDKVRRLPRLSDSPTMEALVELAVDIQNVVATVQGLDEKYLASPQLLTEMVSKLPFTIRALWQASLPVMAAKATLEEFSGWLMQFCNKAPSAGNLDPRVQRPRRHQEHVNVQVTRDKKRDKNCVVCSGPGHRTVTCADYLKLTVADRWEVVRKSALCFVCLEKSHRSPMCSEPKCGVGNCHRNHHRSLHEVQQNSPPTDSIVTNIWKEGCSVLLKIVDVIVSGPDGQVRECALLDEGSTVTLIDAEIAREVGARGPIQGLNIHGARGMCASDAASRRVKVRVRGDGAEYVMLSNTVEGLNLPRQIDSQSRERKPRILIGQDNAHLIVSREIREVSGTRCMMSRTALGWTVHGGTRQEHEYENGVTLTLSVDTQIEALIKTHFQIESLGITAAERGPSADVQRAITTMEQTTRQLDTGHWETGLLWRNKDVWLPDNSSCALNRLLSLERKLAKDDALRLAYHLKISDYVKKGYARELSPEEAEIPSRRKWYLPHFSVTNPNKPGKIRVVFDAASQCRGTSLNDQLVTGPDLLTSLLGHILRFREGKIAVAADIREMFLRIKIRKEDQASQLFLWREEQNVKPKTLVLTSMMFGAKCSPSSAQFVRNKVAELHSEEFPVAATAIKNKFYMDDYLDAMDTPEEAATLASSVDTILERSGFELANWASNDTAALSAIPEDRRTKAAIEIAANGGQSTERVLGILWDPTTDILRFNLKEMSGPEVSACPTKRQFLSAVMRIFDPVGFITCLTVRSKILLQEVWRSGIGWDEPLQESHQAKWRGWLDVLNHSECAIPRCSLQKRDSIVTLHVFCDASEAACCAVAYTVERAQARVETAFVASKCKVAPLRPLSIPRLELQAALMAARLAATIKKECACKIGRVIYWTDSSTVLCWLRTDPRTYSPFVANRLGELDELTNVHEWRWVPTKMNPADMGTRDSALPDLTPEGMWFKGPSFLKQSEEQWPKERKPYIRPEAALEIRTKYVGLITTPENALPNVTRFSSWRRLINATGWVLRFANRCRRILQEDSPGGHALRAEEVIQAERLWIKHAQSDSFGRELQDIRSGGTPLPGSRLQGLTPLFDEHGVLRMGTRLLAVPQEVRAPIILDGTHPYTRLLIRHYHEKAGHPGPENTVSEVRTRFYVLRLRTTARKVAHDCQRCQTKKSHPRPPLMGQLPEARLAHHLRPFTHCGLDFFGPMAVTVGRRREKRYGCLFTCMTTRAIHLEMAANLTSDSTIMAIRRMTARRGQPEIFYSDNGTNFHGADREMRKAVDDLQQDHKLREEMTSRRSEWKFIPPAAPHMGGAWERLIRSVKRALSATLKERAPREETLLTALAEAEHTVNSRPLTHVSVDPEDEEPLTPNHFLIGSSSVRPHLTLFGKRDEEVCLRKQWRISQQLADMFWRRWVKEYLPNLAQRRKWTTKAEPIKEGDLVVIMDPALPRNSWPKGRVISAVPAEDGQVRVVRIKTAAGEYTRPAVKIIVLPVKKDAT